MTEEASRSDQALEDMQGSIARLGHVMREEGIHPHTPLGLWSRALGQAMEAFAAVTTSSADEVRAFRDMAKRETEESRLQLQEACREVRALKEAGEQRLRTQEVFLERDKQFAIDRFVRGMTEDLKEVLFKELKAKLPLEERRFYAQVRLHRIIWVFVASAFLLVGGYWTGSRHSGEVYATGEHCLDNLKRDATSGIMWCQLTPDTNNGGN